MTQKEKVIVRQAIKDLMEQDGDFSGAISRLCKLVGWQYAAGDVASTQTTTVQQYLSMQTRKRRNPDFWREHDPKHIILYFWRQVH